MDRLSFEYWGWVIAVNFSAVAEHDLWHLHRWYGYVGSLCMWFVMLWALDKFAALKTRTVV